ncbi:hypothetical protein B0H34DRAFT_501662 [Crassisporium funariophilum]|nr:hypothetical protein B0H34DRAFT_501662 [Crassisporium funariophilum]
MGCVEEPRSFQRQSLALNVLLLLLTVLTMPFGYHLQGPRIAHHRKRRAIIPGFLYVTFFGIKPKFSVQLGRHVHVN